MKRAKDDEAIEADYYDPNLPILTEGWWWKLMVLAISIAIPTALLLWENGHWPFAR